MFKLAASLQPVFKTAAFATVTVGFHSTISQADGSTKEVLNEILQVYSMY